ncbi:hypothetical protein CC80DRAFT_560601 [Byssothecium circinans]|uniref:AA1-like domain-containing protein n=1 Tax=Byssothecium circinans TaxID=147558 RepID=A0A6A5TXP5_9PLEO|nr:hypothetical protein CC80DRAFT_560601 [Byssothecium circinans]
MRFSILPFIGFAAALPSIIPRQDSSYGFWNVTVTEESGAPGWQTRSLTAWYYRDGLRSTSACRYAFVPQGGAPPSETNTCDNANFEYTWGEPWCEYIESDRWVDIRLTSERADTLNITQTVDIDGQQVTIYGSGLARRQCGLGIGRTCRSDVHAEASIAPL